MTQEKNEYSSHILNTSSNLMGICFIILTSLKVLKLNGTTIIDALTAVATLFFMASSLMSFWSMRSNTKMSRKYERIADGIFIGGLSFLFVIGMLIAFNLIT